MSKLYENKLLIDHSIYLKSYENYQNILQNYYQRLKKYTMKERQNNPIIDKDIEMVEYLFVVLDRYKKELDENKRIRQRIIELEDELILMDVTPYKV